MIFDFVAIDPETRRRVLDVVGASRQRRALVDQLARKRLVLLEKHRDLRGLLDIMEDRLQRGQSLLSLGRVPRVPKRLVPLVDGLVLDIKQLLGALLCGLESAKSL